MALLTIRNAALSLSVDARGRVVSLVNRRTKTELVTHPDAAEAWRMVVPTGRHTIDIILGSKQPAPKIDVVKGRGKQAIVLSYPRVIGQKSLRLAARFTLELEDDADAVSAWVELDNSSASSIDEVEFPVIGGMGGFRQGGKRVMNLVAASDRGTFYEDVLNRGLPVIGREADQYCREHESAFFEPSGPGVSWSSGGSSVWLDLYGEREGVYFGRHSIEPRDFAFKLERYPKSNCNAPAHHYPKGTPRWLRAWAVHVPRLAPGKRWTSERVLLMPHVGDWHAGADVYSAFRHRGLRLATPPSWTRDFVGWTEILGKTYLGEVFHDFRKCADDVVKDAKVTGLDLLFYYGHTAIGAEGADFDQSPASDLGGEASFRRMLDKLHKNGIRVMLLDHLHRWVNRDIPQFRKLKLERFATLDELGRPNTARWWKETFLSCRRLEGPTPVWVEMCPSCEEWLGHYLDHVTRMIERGVDGLELDTFSAGRCFNPNHGHPVGASMFPWKLEFLRRVREHAKQLNPDFILIVESMVPELCEAADGFYPDRYPNENGRIFRYLFPEIRNQAVRVGNYAYDAVNRAMQLGIGVETEIWGLRRTTLAACPEFARYIGEVNRFRRKFGDVMIRGTFRDTVGARIEGDALFGVLEARDGAKALVLRNPHERATKARAAIDGVRGRELALWRPFKGQKQVRRPPVDVSLGPYGVAVLLAL